MSNRNAARETIRAFRAPSFHLDRSAPVDFQSALQDEWLVTNGLGGYASGTVLGVDPRRDHGLLMAALRLPGDRPLRFARRHATIEEGDDQDPLHTAENHDGTIHPVGHLDLDGFHLAGQRPVWRFGCRDVILEKTVWLAPGRNTTFVRDPVQGATGRMRPDPFVAHRDDHAHTHGAPPWRPTVQSQPKRGGAEAYPGATVPWLGLESGNTSSAPQIRSWWRDPIIALPGRCRSTGRYQEARTILTALASHRGQGLLPNRFPDQSEPPDYNTDDATRWFFESLARYQRATGDRALVDELLPALQTVVAWHERGARPGIAVDPGRWSRPVGCVGASAHPDGRTRG